ncbi:MAG: PepSY domain-containing protein [Deinococcota bacterium]|nr:PepSY domain-containing protein [Deinococcota bacterium]
MKRSVTVGLVLASLVLALALAQGMMAEPGNQRSPGMMGDMMPMQEQMQQMVELCTSMMQEMPGMMGMMMGQGMMGQDMGQGMMGPGMMQPGTTVRYSPADAETLARAFLAGHAPGAETEQVEATADAYLISFRDGDTQGTLRVDATTGEVQQVQQPENR